MRSQDVEGQGRLGLRSGELTKRYGEGQGGRDEEDAMGWRDAQGQEMAMGKGRLVR